MNHIKDTNDTKKPYVLTSDALRILLLVAVPLAIIALILERLGTITVYENHDFTNAFGFFVEIGVAVFISILLFRYSKAQQDRAATLLEDVSATTTKLKSISDSLEQQKEQRRKVVLNGISYVLISVWGTSQSALYVICKNGFKEPDLDSKLSEFVRDNLADHQKRVAQNLEHLKHLMLLGAGELNATMVSALYMLQTDLEWRILTQTTLGRAAHPWSGAMHGINRFAKEHFQSMLTALYIYPDLEEFIPKEMLAEMKK